MKKKNELALFNENQRTVLRQSAKKKVRLGAMSTAAVILVIVGAVLLNVILQVLDAHFDLSVDFSQIKVTEIDDYSKEYVEALSHDIEIIVNGSESEFAHASYETDVNTQTGLSSSVFSAKRYTYELLKSFASHTDHITVRYVDTRYNPQFFKDRGIALEEDTFITVYCEDTKRSFQIGNEVFDSAEYVGLERRLDGAMEYVGTDALKTVGFVIGHDETLPGYLVDLLGMNAYGLTQVDLTKSDVSSVDMLVIVAPMSDYSAAEIKALRSFLTNDGELGKSLAVFMDADSPACPRLENFLTEWGIEYTTQTVFDRSASLTVFGENEQPSPLLRLRYAQNELSHDVADTLYTSSEKLCVTLGKARAVKILPMTDNRACASLLTSFGTGAFGVDYTVKQLDATKWSDITMGDDDTAGPFDLGAIAYIGGSERVDQGSGYTYYSKMSYVAAFGTTALTETYFLSDFDGSAPADAPYVLSLFRYITGRDSYVMIYSTPFTSGTMTFDSDLAVRIVCAVVIGLVPAVCAVLCIVRGRKRKYL